MPNDLTHLYAYARGVKEIALVYWIGSSHRGYREDRQFTDVSEEHSASIFNVEE
jgi:hypothetical protein